MTPLRARLHLAFATTAAALALASCGDDSNAAPATDAGADAAGDVADDAPDASDGDAVDGATDTDSPDTPVGPCGEPGPAPQFETTELVRADTSGGPPLNAVADVVTLDLDGDGHQEYVFAEPAQSRLRMLDGCETQCETLDLFGVADLPVRLAVFDADGDGSVDDLIIGSVGSIDSSDERVASVYVATNDDGWTVQAVATELRRVACIVPADLDEDGTLDIVICEFGDINGDVTVLWGGDLGFSTTQIAGGPGSIGAAVFDADEDGDLDVVVAFSQTTEQVVLLEATGDRTFSRRVLFDPELPWYGHSSLRAWDLDLDGRLDIVFTNGDPGDLETAEVPDGLHGLNVLWNRGEGEFEYERLADLLFAYTTSIADFDGDCVPDIAVFSVPELGPELAPGEVPAILVRPAAPEGERVSPITGAPQNVVGVAATDFDGDGDMDLVGGRFSATGEATDDLVFVSTNGGTTER